MCAVAGATSTGRSRRSLQTTRNATTTEAPMSNFLSITLVSFALIVGTVAAYSPERTKVGSASSTSVAPPLPTPTSVAAKMRDAPATKVAPVASPDDADDVAQARRRAVERRRAEARQGNQTEREQAARLPAGFVGLMLIAGGASRPVVSSAGDGKSRLGPPCPSAKGRFHLPPARAVTSEAGRCDYPRRHTPAAPAPAAHDEPAPALKVLLHRWPEKQTASLHPCDFRRG